MSLKKLFTAAALLLAPALAFAHPGHGDNGLVAGISHPLGGIDHLLAMVAVGFVGRPTKRRRTLGPAVHLCRHHVDWRRVGF